MMNMFWEPLEFEVPVYPGRAWHVAVDTFAPSPNDAGEHAARRVGLRGAGPEHRGARRNGLVIRAPARAASVKSTAALSASPHVPARLWKRRH
jgi:hypothetical protein